MVELVGRGSGINRAYPVKYLILRPSSKILNEVKSSSLRCNTTLKIYFFDFYLFVPLSFCLIGGLIGLIGGLFGLIDGLIGLIGGLIGLLSGIISLIVILIGGLISLIGGLIFFADAIPPYCRPQSETMLEKHWSPQAGRTSHGHELDGGSALCCHTINRLDLSNMMKALHMLWEVILCSEDVSTVGDNCIVTGWKVT